MDRSRWRKNSAQQRSFHYKTPVKAVFIGHECYAYAHWQSYIAARKLFTPLT
jgi:hypothetical protein